MISKIIKQKDMLLFLKIFYNLEKDELLQHNDRGHYVVQDFHYTGWTEIDESADLENRNLFFISIDEVKHNIIAIIKFSTELVENNLKTYKGFAGCMYYLEIEKKYQHQHLLSTITDEFAKIYPKYIFVSNEESDKGKIAHVNDHLKQSFKKYNLIFFDNDENFIKEMNQYL